MDAPNRDQVVAPITEPLNIEGWEIEQSIGPGPLGRHTANAVGRKNGQVIQATASAPAVALEVLKDMIRKRDG